MAHNLPLSCHVDEDGCYTADVGIDSLVGCDVLRPQTTQYILDLLSQEVLHSEDFVHSYPYDWRTKRPVILRACRQWFIDTNQLKARAVEALKSVRIRPESAANSFQVPVPVLTRVLVPERTVLVPLPVVERLFYYMFLSNNLSSNAHPQLLISSTGTISTSRQSTSISYFYSNPKVGHNL
jgi:isoleucyl-tRNA synthetase